ncbi:MAG TPA: triose-phosphate isomerase [Polyangia bacterium]|nr:triose-phosphate isomerase [Polyangia bacterium]HWE29442.1 triose-phosphate isomerase [Polyangia bacterium]
MSANERTKLICGNWKLHKTIAESLELATAIKNVVGPVRDVEVAVAPVFTALHAVAKRLEGSSVALAAQNCFWEDHGAFTGEVSCKQLKDVGCKYVIIAHSERRQHFGEVDATANLKVKAALRNGLDPILCVGETLAERDAGKEFDVVRRHLEGGLAELTHAEAERLVVAYEPVWAIGTGRTATPQQAQEMHHFIRTKLAEQFKDVAQRVRIQYGGSVKPDNAAQLMGQADIDGALVGGASLKADDFLKIVKYRNG